MRLSTSPQETVVLRLEQRKSFSFAVLFRDGGGGRADITGAVLTLDWLINPGRLERHEDLQPADVRTVVGTLVTPSSGYARVDVQAADLDSEAGSYPFTLTLRTAEGYSVVVVKGTIELQMNPELASADLAYVVGEPAMMLDVVLRGSSVIEVEVGSIVPPGMQYLSDVDKAKIDLIRVEAGTIVVDLADYVLATTLASTVATLEQATATVATDLEQLDGEVSSIEGRVDSAETAITAAADERAAGFSVLTGEMKMWPGAAAPTGWLMCHGQILLKADYPALYAVVGDAYKGGATLTSLQFRVPEMRERVPLGQDEIYPRGVYGGSNTHQMTIPQMPSHTHIQNAHTHTQNPHGHTQNLGAAWSNVANVAGAGIIGNANVSATQSTTATNIAATATNQSTGGGEAFNIMQMYTPINFIIKS